MISLSKVNIAYVSMTIFCYVFFQIIFETYFELFHTGLSETIFWMRRANSLQETQLTFKLYNGLWDYSNLSINYVVVAVTFLMSILAFCVVTFCLQNFTARHRFIFFLAPSLLVFLTAPGRNQLTIIFVALFALSYSASLVGVRKYNLACIFAALIAAYLMYHIHGATLIFAFLYLSILFFDRKVVWRIRIGLLSRKLSRFLIRSAVIFSLVGTYRLTSTSSYLVDDYATASSTGLVWIVVIILLIMHLLVAVRLRLLRDPSLQFILITSSAVLVAFSDYNFMHLLRSVMMPAWISEIVFLGVVGDSRADDFSET